MYRSDDDSRSNASSPSPTRRPSRICSIRSCTMMSVLATIGGSASRSARPCSAAQSFCRARSPVTPNVTSAPVVPVMHVAPPWLRPIVHAELLETQGAPTGCASAGPYPRTPPPHLAGFRDAGSAGRRRWHRVHARNTATSESGRCVGSGVAGTDRGRHSLSLIGDANPGPGGHSAADAPSKGCRGDPTGRPGQPEGGSTSGHQRTDDAPHALFVSDRLRRRCRLDH